MPQETIIVSIGRGSGEDQLSDVDWSTFQLDVLDAIDWTTFTTTGFSDSDYGMEESYTVGALLPPPQTYGRLKATLRDLASKYGQDSIAFTTGSTELLVSDPLFAVIGGFVVDSGGSTTPLLTTPSLTTALSTTVGRGSW